MEIVPLATDDGWTVHLYHLEGASGAPVLFVHGMGANRFNFDLNERHSLARAALAQGYDPWIVEMRGRGRSRAAKGNADWNFEDFLHRDLRRMVPFVVERRGQALHWVGHSMGGMLGVAYQESHPGPEVRSLTLFGTPLAFEKDQLMLRLWGHLVRVHRFLPTMDQEAWGRRMLPLMRQSPEALKFFLRYLANPDNIDPATSQDIFARLVTNESAGITLQFSDWVRRGEVRSADGGFNYTGELPRVRVPALFFSGPEDRMAPAEITARMLSRLGSSLRRQVVLSMENGFSADYGHGDLLLGKEAPAEVYPMVFRWLREVDQAATPPR
ncbi:MAG: alpha/beta hydrolase [Myxococcales bacterium]|nr:alpha/beta hydrolase [Myxococcales bacterium]